MTHSEKDLTGKLYPNRDAKITVFGQVDEGTEIHIAELSLRISSPVSGTTFYYKS